MKKYILFLVVVLLLTSCSKEPETYKALKSAGQKAFVKQDYPTARKYFLEALHKNQSDKDLLYLLGLSYQRDFLMDSALLYLKRADLLFPNERETNLAIYQAALDLQDWEAAIKAIHVLVKTGDPIEMYYNQLAQMNLKIGHYVVAYIFAKKELETHPDIPNNYIQLGNVAAILDSFDVAINTMDSATKKFGDKDVFLLNKGIYYSGKRNYKKAEKIFRSLLLKDSTSIPTKVNLANILSQQKSRKKKLEAYHLYKEIQPKITTDVFKIDSTITALKKELKIK